ncbi:MAG: M28 family peptidase [Planctomycetota bacterium]
MRRTLSLVLLLVLAPAASALQAAEGGLGAALDAVREARIRADIEFLASDELRGRDTPSDGLRIAARYIRARLMRLGFQPGGEDGGFFDLYELERKRLDLEKTGVTVVRGDEEKALTFGNDYVFSSREVDDLTTEGALTFVGMGTEADVAGLDLSGRWAVAYDSDLPWRERRNNVRGAGAIGLAVMPGPDYDDLPYTHPKKFGSWVWRARTGSISLPEEGQKAVFPQLYVLREVGLDLVGEAPGLGQQLDVRVRDTRGAAEGRERFTAENVCGFWPGNDPELASQVLIVSAHYDHVGARDGEIYNGADDNASGTTGLLSIAEALAAHGPMSRSVLLIWVSGEEKGLLGSKAWTLNPTLPEGYTPAANINIDMIGRNAADYLLITPTQELPQYNELVRMAEAHAPQEGFPELGSCDEYWARSDQQSFSENLGIPVMFLFSDVHDDYHQPSDTAEKIDCDKIRRVSRLVVRMLDALQAKERM